MSVSRPFIWKCDRCPETEAKLSYGLPKNWNWLVPNGPEEPLIHICPSCRKPGDRIGVNK